MDKFIRFFEKHRGMCAGSKSVFCFFILFLLLSNVSIVAAPVDRDQIGRAGKKFLAQRDHFAKPSRTDSSAAEKTQKHIRQVAPLEKDNAIIGYVVHMESQGFILMAADDNAPPVKLYSDDCSFDQLPPGFRAVIETEMREDLAQLAAMSDPETEFHQEWTMLLDDPNTIQAASSGTYLLSTTWNQSYPYNYYCPTVTSGGSGGRAYAGCGATAMAQILRYHYSPTAVTSNYSYTDNSGSCTGTFSMSDAGLDDYDWANMPASISSSSTTAQKEAVGQLIYHCGVAQDSDYEADGTGASTGVIASALRNYFGYTCNNYVEKSSYTTTTWFNKIVTDIDAGRPIFYTMWEADGNNGHAVVCDGYNSTDSTIHLNLGWSGSGNAWYSVSSVSYSGYTWTIHGGVFNITAPTYGSLSVTLNPQEAIDAGVQWRRSGTTTWYNSGETETNIATGSYTVEFKAIIGWATPADVDVTITKDQITEVTASYVSSPEITIGSGTSTWYYPLATSNYIARTEAIYLADEIGGACTLYSLALNITTVPGQMMNDFTIRMKHTDLSAYSSKSWDSTDWVTVYQADQTISTTGWTEFVFSTPFEYNGTQNLMVDISFNNSSASSAGYCYCSTPGGNRSLRYRISSSSYGAPTTWSGTTPTPTIGTSVPNIRLTIASKTADLTGDGFVDMADFAFFSLWWQSECNLSNNWCDGADLDWSGQLDLLDLEAFVSYWLSEI